MTGDGSVVVCASSEGCVVATDVASKTQLWTREMEGSVYTLRIHGSLVVVPVYNASTVVLDVMTGARLHEYPKLAGATYDMVLFDGLFVSL